MEELVGAAPQYILYLDEKVTSIAELYSSHLMQQAEAVTALSFLKT